MNIGQASRRSGLPAKTIRYYEEIGLVSPARRDNGYRQYSDQVISKLVFLQRARSLGFTIDDCRQLVSLYEDKDRASADVKRLASKHLDEIEHKLAELNGLKQTLSTLIEACKGDDRPDCPIIDSLAAGRANETSAPPSGG